MANRRVVRTLKARPIDLVDADRAAMLALPPIPPTVGWVNQIRLGRDYYVRVDSNDYSVDPTAIGRQVTVTADLRTGAGASRRPARRRSRPGVGPPHDRHRPRPRRDRPAAARTVRAARGRVDDSALLRDLADYDRAFGLDGRGRVMAAKQQRAVGRGQADPLPRRRVEGTTDRRGRRPARRPGP